MGREFVIDFAKVSLTEGIEMQFRIDLCKSELRNYEKRKVSRFHFGSAAAFLWFGICQNPRISPTRYNEPVTNMASSGPASCRARSIAWEGSETTNDFFAKCPAISESREAEI